MNEQVRRRRIERHCGASIRALAGHPKAEYRRQLLFENGNGVELFCPHLASDVIQHSLGRSRGVADGMALRLAHSDLTLHRQLSPSDEVGKLVFDILEQLRVESLAPEGLRGVKMNLDQAFNEWCRQSRAEGLTENETGLLIYSITQIVRSRLNNQQQDEEVEGLIESTRFMLAPLVGDQLALMRGAKSDQKLYAELALEIAGTISKITQSVWLEAPDESIVKIRQRLILPRQHEPDDRYVEGGVAGSGQPAVADDRVLPYPVFCRDFDRQLTGDKLYRLEQRNTLRLQLDRLVVAQAISVPRLAHRLKMLFAVMDPSGWNFGEEEGYLDGRRLGQLVANPAYSRIFKQQKLSPRCDTVVSFLIDNSGSMKRQRFEAVAVMVDVYARALELAGVRSEILGFTTGGWTGGRSMGAFRAAGMPADPGRLNDRLHIVYKDADTSWRRARYSIASMLTTTHFREGLDGEALQWACQRLERLEESRKCLVMISDGAPMDSATCQYNDELFLERHLKQVVHNLESSSTVELRAIGIGLDMSEFFTQSVALDLTGTLGNNEFRALETLYG